MRKSFIFLSLLTALLAADTSCKKNDTPIYSGKDNVYFSNNITTKADTLNISFGYNQPSYLDSTVKLIVKVLGNTAAVNRGYKVNVLADSTTAIAGLHYDALPDTFAILAGKVADTLRIVAHRTPDMQQTNYTLFLQLVPNDYFSTYMQYSATYRYNVIKMTINDILARPKNWLDVYLGTFTRKKIYLMAEILDLDIMTINSNTSIANLNYWGKYTQLYLNDKKAAGAPVYEDDGSVMIMGTAVQ
ncbi:protein of unknown function [Filimonas lacunae]|uniref:DUF4843 domain-containing protein n=1 Tax=Filimonas lacunae TaxID=477680 RepID=A0A173MP99_9BACT|nr:DUF4843 domain-containing protein [Filimonas lacunae]BAV09289.1 hypothetical protein FLA_5337 [Filimonas lacunae]SIS70554.1 protein of unknown function [Filimonas lacunae]